MSEPNTRDLNNLQAAGCFYEALHRLHQGASLLSDRAHTRVDEIEGEVYAMVGGHRDCPGCDTPTPKLLLDREGGSGECPRCDNRAGRNDPPV